MGCSASSFFLAHKRSPFFARTAHSQPPPGLMTTEIALLPYTHSHFVLFQAEEAIALWTIKCVFGISFQLLHRDFSTFF